MIKKLRVSNFLSLKEVDLELRGRNVLVGPNMSGKSNLIDCIKFLAALGTPNGLSKAFADRGGFREVLWKGSNVPRIDLRVTAELRVGESAPPKIYDYDISIFGSSGDAFVVTREKLTVGTGGQMQKVLDLDAAKPQGELDIGDGHGLRPFGPQDRTRSALEYISFPGFEGTTFKDFVSSWRFYALMPALMRQSNPATPQNFLMEHGDNFSSWFMTLQLHPEEFRKIKQAATDVLPDLAEILIQPTQSAAISISTREKHLKRPIGISRMSDGEISFLALLSLIFAPAELAAPLYCIEEPETHLHPALLETVVELLDQRQDELGERAAQVIATTHSPLLVDKLSIDDLLVVEKVDGQTKFTRPSSDENLKQLLARKELGLGDLWYSGALNRA